MDFILPMLLLLPHFNLVSAETYYVTPTSSTACPGEPCLTISEYAAELQNNVSSVVTMAFLEGEHMLSQNLSFQNLDEFSLTNIAPGTKVNVFCSYGANFQLQNIVNVSIDHIELHGCNGNAVTIVETFFLKNCLIQGLSRIGNEMFHVTDTQDLSISNCSFISNWVRKTQRVNCALFKLHNSNMTILHSEFANNSASSLSGLGSVICAFNSSIIIEDSTFAENIGTTGGVLYAEHSDIAMLGTSFVNNAALDGGVAYLSHISYLTVDRCIFSNNSCNKYGGVLCVTGDSIVEAKNSSFTHNTALSINARDPGRGGVLRVSNSSSSSFYSCTFIGNKANTAGVVFAIYQVQVNLIDSVFYINAAISPLPYLGYAAVLHTQSNSIVLIRGCIFKSNSANSSGGCGNIFRNGHLQVSGTNIFENNTAIYGGAFTVWASTININTDCSNVSICEQDCLAEFIGNTAQHGGALNIIQNSTAHIHCSSFRNNTAKFRGGAVLVRTDTFIDLINTDFRANNAISRGGALFAQFTNVHCGGYLTIEDNSGGSGVVYMTSCSANITGNSTFSNNKRSFLAHNSYIVFTAESTFYGGTVDVLGEGGAITAVRSTLFFDGNLLLKNNNGKSGGAMLVRESVVNYYGSCIFFNNSAASGGALNAYKSDVQIKGSAMFRSNRATENGGGIFAVSSTFQYYSQYSSFIDNTATNGGAVYFDHTSSLYIVKEVMECSRSTEVWYCTNAPETWLVLLFAGNFASGKGGALYVGDTDATSCSSSHLDPDPTYKECFIQTVAVYESANDWILDRANLANINFTNNSASDGALLYGGLLDRCAIDSFAEQLQLVSDKPDALTYFSKMSLTNISYTEISSGPVRICLCEDNKINCSLSPPKVYVKSGQTFSLSVAVVNQVDVSDGNQVIVNAYLASKSSRLGKDQSEQSVGGACSVLHYNIFSAVSETLSLYPDGPCANRGISKIEIKVNINSTCPIGFSLSDSSLECECDPDIQYITNCSIDSESVIREGNYWIDSVSNENDTDVIVHKYCPYDYCYPPTDKVEVNLNEANGSDAQCALKRSGRLCGSCEDGYSLTLGSSKCEKCSNYWLFLILPFGLVGIGLVVIMMTCNLTLASGTLNGLLFYANILIANRVTFFPLQKQDVLTVFISWLGLNLGISTCFYDGMDGFGKTWVQISFEVYLIFLVVMIIVLGRSVRISSLFHRYRLHPVHTLATLLMLSYEKLTRRIFSLVAYTHLTYPNKTITVWLFDPSLSYIEGKHISLAVVAFFILVTAIIFNIILLFSKVLVAKSKSVYFIKFMESFHAPLKSSHQYWVGLLFLGRILSYFTTEFINAGDNPSYNLHFIFILVSVLLLLKFVFSSTSQLKLCIGKKPVFDEYSVWDDQERERENSKPNVIIEPPGGIVYKKPFIDLLETSFLMNLLVLTYFTLYTRNEGGSQNILFYVSSSVALVTFIGILIYHTCVYTSLAKLFKRKETHTFVYDESYAAINHRTSTQSEVSVF